MSILPQAQSSTGVIQRCWHSLLGACCLLCGSSITEGPICPPCEQDLPRLNGPCCPRCAEPTTHGEHCGTCLHTPPAFDSTRGLFRYEFPVDRMIHALKYGHQLAFAPWMGQGLLAATESLSIDMILAMPLHPTRLRERGFNQAMELARPIAQARGIALHPQALQRVLATAAQAGLQLKLRHSNLRGAFACAHDLRGRRILLIDDVMTSGASAREAARVLRLHGAKEIHIAVVARALKP